MKFLLIFILNSRVFCIKRNLRFDLRASWFNVICQKSFIFMKKSCAAVRLVERKLVWVFLIFVIVGSYRQNSRYDLFFNLRWRNVCPVKSGLVKPNRLLFKNLKDQIIFDKKFYLKIFTCKAETVETTPHTT